MNNKDLEIQWRVDKEYPQVSPGLYAEGLMDIVSYLLVDLRDLMQVEDRFFGIVKQYYATISNAQDNIYPTVTDEKMEIFGRILYLFKPVLRREFKRLNRKGLSPADSVICIIRKMLSIIEEIPEYTMTAELKAIQGVIDKLHSNIRYKVKLDALYNLGYIVKTYIGLGKVGKYSLDCFTISGKVGSNIENEKLEDNNRLVDNNSLVTEIKL